MSPKPSLPALLLRTQSDARLTTLARDGHERAFEAIVERYRKPLLARVRRMLSPERAEDVVQQTFLSTWTAIEKGTEIRDLRAWLYRVAVNHGLNAINSSGYDYDELKESLQGGTPPAEDAERRLVIRETLAGIAGLPDRQREALLQIAVGGRSHAEVARELGMTDTAVRQLVHRARTTLRAAATAVTPVPLLNWALALAARGGGEPAQRIAEAAAGGGGAAGLTAALVKGSAVVAVVAAVATPAVMEKQHHAHSGDVADTAEASASDGPVPSIRMAAVTPGIGRAARRNAAKGRGRGRKTGPRGRGGERGRDNGRRLGTGGADHGGPHRASDNRPEEDHGGRRPGDHGGDDGRRRPGDGGDRGPRPSDDDHSGSSRQGSGGSGSGGSGSGGDGSGASGGESGTGRGSETAGTTSTEVSGDSGDGVELHSSDSSGPG